MATIDCVSHRTLLNVPRNFSAHRAKLAQPAVQPRLPHQRGDPMQLSRRACRRRLLLLAGRRSSAARRSAARSAAVRRPPTCAPRCLEPADLSRTGRAVCASARPLPRPLGRPSLDLELQQREHGRGPDGPIVQGVRVQDPVALGGHASALPAQREHGRADLRRSPRARRRRQVRVARRRRRVRVARAARR